jgi:hypothetical protein
MDESQEQKYNRIADSVQKSILRDYPNPNREGCPGDAAVRQVAARTELRKDEFWQHITHCSPCYAEFLRYKNELRDHGKRRLHTRRSALIAASVMVAAAGGASVFLLRERQIYNVDWDLESQKTFRGLNADKMEGPSGPPLSAPAARLHISLEMRKDSPPGQYVVQLWKTMEAPPLFSKTVQISAASARVTIDADLTDATPGSYTLGVRRSAEASWRYFPVTVVSA